MNFAQFPDLDIVRLRLAAGFLGEKDQSAWWSSDFLGRNAGAFMTPIFSNKTRLAQYHGVTEAACRVHDDHIGVGRAFHLFRLPERLEQRLFDHLLHYAEPADFDQCYASTESAEQILAALAAGTAQVDVGPMRVGTTDMFDGSEWVLVLAAHYQAAFKAGIQCYPYFTERQ